MASLTASRSTGTAGVQMASAPYVAFAPATVAKQAGDQWLATSAGRKCGVAQNQINNGEMWMKNPAALPKKECFHKKADFDQDWYLRNAGRERHRAHVNVLYYNENPLLKKHFNAGAIGQDHSRRVFQELAHFSRSHSEGSILALKHDKELQREMKRRYKEVMCSKPRPPGPVPPAPVRPAGAVVQRSSAPQKLPPMRESSAPAASGKAAQGEDGRRSGQATGSSPTRRQARERGTGGDKALQSLPEGGIAQPVPEASAAALTLGSEGLQAGEVGSTVSRCRPSASVVSGMAPARSQVSACPPAASHISAAQPDGTSAVHASQLSISDFYSWRPKLIS